MDILAGPTPALSQLGHPQSIRTPWANQDTPSQSGHPGPIRTPQTNQGTPPPANQDTPSQSGQVTQPPSPSTSSLGSSFTLRVLPLHLFSSFTVYSPHLPASAPVSGSYSLCLELYPKASPHQGTKSPMLSLRQKPQGSSLTCSRDKGLRGGAPLRKTQ